MIKIIAKLMIAEDKIDSFKAAATELVTKSRAEEGNVFYTLNASTSNPCQMAFVECWKDQNTIDFHNATEHFTGILPKLVDMCTEAPVIESFEEIM